MKILALDSTALISSCAVCEDDKLLSLFSINNGNTHSETLLPMIEASLKILGLTADDIDIFAASEGPGSFTGVRIGAATIKGLAFGKNKPCIGVSTIEALAYNLKGLRGIACPVMNARRNQVYNALFSISEDKIERLCPDRAISVEELIEELKSKYEKVYLCGDGTFLFDNSDFSFEPTPAPLIEQSAFSVACVALEKFKRGEVTTDTALSPTYLRPSQAERERIENEKNK